MRHARRPRLEGLESRQLLTTSHLAAAASVHADYLVLLPLDGTLTVSRKPTSVVVDHYGDTTRSTPVAGVLGTVGKVQGTWTEEANAYGDPLTADTLQLHNAQGSFVVSFRTEHHGKAHKTVQGTSFEPLAEHLSGGTKEYKRAYESGAITVNTDPTGKVVESMTIASKNGQ